MDALRMRTIVFALCAVSSLCLPKWATGATFQTRNFSVTADRSEVAEKVGQAAEEYRRQLAIFWLGQPLPNWSKPCKLKVKEGAFGAGGQTTFQFVRGEVLNWDMSVQGSLERILDSVLPHEVNHTIFACHFRRPLPRWADEGAATLFEHRSEQLKQLALLNEVISKDRERFSLQQLLSMKEYPQGMRPMLILYAQGYALADFLVQQRGRKAYLQFLSDGEKIGWEEAIRKNFDHAGINALERNWSGWVLAGMPKLTIPKDQMVAATSADEMQSQSTARVAPHSTDPSKTRSAVSSAWSETGGADAVTLARPFSGRASKNALFRSQSPDDTPESGITADSEPDKRRIVNAGLETGRNSSEDATGILRDRNSSPAANDESGNRDGNASSSVDRRATIQAPVPRVRQSAGKADHAESDRHDAGARQTSADFPNAADRIRYLEKVDGDGDGNGQRMVPHEVTAASSVDIESESEFPGTGIVSSFESVHLPGKRSVVTGTKPEWAGFPGQKKLF